MGGADCELVGSGWLAQPANAWSSGAYLAAAVYVLWRRPRAGATSSPVPVVGAAALALVSFATVAYHGPQPSWAEAAHDRAIVVLLAVLLVRGLGEGFRLGPGGVPAIAAGGALAVVTALVVAAPYWSVLVHGSLAIAIAMAEVRRRRRAEVVHDRSHRVALLAFGLGLVLYALGRTGGPLCSPASPVQAHAGWHALTAVAAAATLSAGAPSARSPIAVDRRPGGA